MGFGEEFYQKQSAIVLTLCPREETRLPDTWGSGLEWHHPTNCLCYTMRGGLPPPSQPLISIPRVLLKKNGADNRKNYRGHKKSYFICVPPTRRRKEKVFLVSDYFWEKTRLIKYFCILISFFLISRGWFVVIVDPRMVIEKAWAQQDFFWTRFFSFQSLLEVSRVGQELFGWFSSAPDPERKLIILTTNIKSIFQLKTRHWEQKACGGVMC